MFLSIARLEPVSSNGTSLAMAMLSVSLLEPATKILIPVNVARGNTWKLHRFMLDVYNSFLESPLACFSSIRHQASFGDLISRDDLYATESINVNHCGRNTGFDHLPKLLPRNIYSIS